MSATFKVGLLVGLLPFAFLFAPPPTNPKPDPSRAIESVVAVPPEVGAVLRRACYACHSNETHWPWYSRIPGVGHMIQKDVSNARAAMNFSEWNTPGASSGNRTAGLLLAACADVQTGRMPKARYRVLHPEANLSPQEVHGICQWATVESARSRYPGASVPDGQ